jgi:thiamine-phosphate diphosphorylase
VRALQLPPLYLITPYPQGEAFFQELQASLEAGARLLQFRAKALPEIEWISAASRAVELCRRYGASLLLNAEPARAVALGAAGTHLDCRRLWAWQQRPVPASVLLAASCHTAEDLAQARRIGVDFVVLSPVRPTRSHPQAPPLGWQRFSELAEQAAYPVYALGGMGAAHLSWAWAHGGQGVAGISEFWGQPAAIGRILRDEA